MDKKYHFEKSSEIYLKKPLVESQNHIRNTFFCQKTKTASSRSHNCDEFFVAKLSFNLWLVIGSYVFFFVNVIQKNDNVGNILDIPQKISI